MAQPDDGTIPVLPEKCRNAPGFGFYCPGAIHKKPECAARSGVFVPNTNVYSCCCIRHTPSNPDEGELERLQ